MQIYVHEFNELNEIGLIVPDCTKDTDYWLVQNYPKWFKNTLNKTTPPKAGM